MPDELTPVQPMGSQENPAGGPARVSPTSGGFEAPAAPTTPTGAEPTGEGQTEPSKFEGKTREEVLQSYTELERKWKQKEQDYDIYKEFSQRVAPLFDITEKEIALRPDAAIEYLAAKGVLPNKEELDAYMKNRHMATQNMMGIPHAPTIDPKQKFLEDFEKDPIAAVDRRIEERATELANQRLRPVENDLKKMQEQAMMNDVRARDPEFDKLRPNLFEWLKKNPMPIHDSESLYRALQYCKQDMGYFVNRSDHVALQGQLQELSAMPHRGNQRPFFNDANMSDDEALGLNQTGGKDAERNLLLFGKSLLRD